MTAKAFASAGLFALVFDGLRRQGIAPPEPPPGPGLRHAAPPVVAHVRKRDLLAAVMESHGPVPILRVGEAVADHGFQPMLHALLRARGPSDLIGRWLRLERYAHSHHRTAVDRLGEHDALLRHVSTDGSAPSAAEDLLVLGMYLGLLRAIGCRDVSAGIGAERVALPDGGWVGQAAARAVEAGETATWHIAWTGWQAVRPGGLPAEAEHPRGAPAVTFGDCAEAAARLDLSPRALQRRLSAHGLTATAVGRAVQVRHACALLTGRDDPLPAIGYVCGFSDQAHFTREFRKRVNMTPGAYRALAQRTDVKRAP